MQTLTSRDVWSFLPGEAESKKVQCKQIREIPKNAGGENGHFVKDYRELARKVAELQFRNPEFVLLFRGQNKDHPTAKSGSSIKPRLFRPASGKIVSPAATVVSERYETLRRAENALLKYWKQKELPNQLRLEKFRVLRWAILQHYEMCDTPLLDVTHSLRIACSFAASDATEPDAFLMVLAVPQISGTITVSAENELQVLRLASICPPAAERPHLQEAYLLGDYPDLTDFDQKKNIDSYEIDFGRRLIAKFRFNPSGFWRRDDVFPRIPLGALTPTERDPVLDIRADVREAAGIPD